ncbi:STY4534 family ICE replication protein [Pectobacterium actinidiae]|uniref:STY4534 family ICE replication protein n=1 Tax=Pectobacterium actinidiae TaxID=1507808 RepID=UPI002A819B14|nr:STY4534 family ICE replication protein [Pectobacterium actinidiae]MDY4317579.1 STY4534 family ICE replication protein [Pectobacterium actinidiae]
MSANNNTQAQNQNNSQAGKSEYFNLLISGMGYVSNIRHANGSSGQFLTCVINALSGPADKVSYVRFDVTVVGKEAPGLIERCQKAVDEDQKVLIGFTLSNLSADIFTLKSGEHAGEQRVSQKARLIKVDWIKVGQKQVYKAEKSDSVPPQNNGTAAAKSYANNSF